MERDSNKQEQPRPPQASCMAVQGASHVNVQMDAGRVEKPRAAEKLCLPQKPHRTCGAEPARSPAPSTADRIELKSKSGGMIQAENLGGVLEPGGIFRLGNKNVTHHYHHERPSVHNRFPLTESTTEPVIRHLDVISAGLAEDCHALGQRLGLDKASLEQIGLDYQHEGQHEINYRILALWKQRTASSMVSLKTLAKALADIGRGDLADELRRD